MLGYSLMDHLGRLTWGFGGSETTFLARSRTFFGNSLSMASSVVHSFGSFFLGLGIGVS